MPEPANLTRPQDGLGLDDATAQIIALAVSMKPGIQPLSADAILADAGLDSLAMVRLLVALEEHFSLVYPSGALTPENFATSGTIARLTLAERARRGKREVPLISDSDPA